MLKYAIVEIAGKQYKAEPEKLLIVSNLGEIKSLECDKVLVIADDKDLKIGNPYLKDKLTFELVENIQGDKIRISKYKPKANYRKVRGFRSKLSKIKLIS